MGRGRIRQPAPQPKEGESRELIQEGEVIELSMNSVVGLTVP